MDTVKTFGNVVSFEYMSKTRPFQSLLFFIIFQFIS